MDQHRNFAVSTIAGVPSPATSGVSATVAAGDGGNFPAVPFQAIICPAGSQPTLANAEIVRVTAMTGDAITTMVRAQEGTSPRAVVAGDTIHAGPTKRWWDDVETGIANALPVVNPVAFGQLTIQTIAGGAGATNSLFLLANSNGSPTGGNIDMVGNGLTTFRHRLTDGHTHIGSDIGGASGLANAIPNVRLMVTARDNTIAFHSYPISVGTGIGVFTSTAEPLRVANGPNANATGLFSSLEIEAGTGGSAAEHIATFSLSRNYDPNYNGCSVAGQMYGYANVNTFSGLHADGCLPFGADIKARVDTTVTDASHPALSSIETGGTDDSWHRQTNVGLAIRIVNQGKNHIRNALVISNTPSRPGAFENGLVIATGALSSLYGPGWGSTTAYLGGELLNVSGTKYVCKTAVTGGTGPGVDTAHWFAVGAISVPPTWVTGRDHDVHTLVTDAGATWACAVFHANGTTAPHLDQWNGFNGVAGPDGLASATASAGHWVPWTNSIGITDRYVNTGLTSHTTSPGYPIWVGPIAGTGMNGNAPSGAGQTFSVDTSGNMVAAGNIGFNGQPTQALTGWATPTGAPSRATYDIPTVTLTGLAGRVAGLIIDLMNNGVIG